jgi:hypothetical protein
VLSISNMCEMHRAIKMINVLSFQPA